MKKRQQQQSEQQQQKGCKDLNSYQQYQIQKQIQCNKGKTCKFKRSGSNLEDDGASSAILLLACIACTTPSY